MALIVRLLIWNSKNSNAFVKNQTISLSNIFLNKRACFLETIIFVCQHLNQINSHTDTYEIHTVHNRRTQTNGLLYG